MEICGLSGGDTPPGPAREAPPTSDSDLVKRHHFFETNRALAFDRAASLGFRLNIAAGTAVR